MSKQSYDHENQRPDAVFGGSADWRPTTGGQGTASLLDTTSESDADEEERVEAMLKATAAKATII